MFKRRLAVLGAVCALALTGLAGSALADDPHSTAGAKVTCTTSDGRTIELPELQPGKPAGIMAGPDGEVKPVDPDEIVKEAVPAEKLPEGSEEILIEKTDGDAVRVHPAKPGELADVKAIKVFKGKAVKVAEGEDGPSAVAEALEGGEPGKMVKIVCKKPE
ncbi:hypothetical protein ACTMTI_05760 [Nonomuraea sp. H19]|uniref:hypothetical protein n=1 Tax=Nonomuraea sp. H19 TaxID=3452206 RepID=UPI003F89CEAF